MTHEIWPPYVALILFGFLPSVFWKFLSAFIAHGIDENSPILIFVRAMATTLLAGVACKLLVAPTGALAQTPIALRLGAMLIGLAAWRIAGRSVFAAVAAAELVLAAGAWGLGP